MRFVAITILCLIVLWSYRNPGQVTVRVNQTPDFRTTAGSLFEKYRSDWQQAEQFYLDRIIQVVGTVARVEQDTAGQTAIILVGDSSRLTGVECLTDSSQIPRIRQISSGQKVLVKGYGDKSKIHVRLKGCRLLDSQSNLTEDSLDSEHDRVQEREQPKENS